MPQPKPFFLPPFLAVVLVLMVIVNASRAFGHIDSNSMPDAVAEMEYRILLEFKPEDTVSRNKLAMVLYRLNKLEEAKTELTTILTASPHDFNALDLMGVIALQQKRYAEALQYCKSAAAVNPEDAMVHYHLGQVLTETGAYDEAEQAYRTGLKKTDAGANAKNNNAPLFEEALRALETRRKIPCLGDEKKK